MTGQLRSYVLAFILGFGSCAAIARLMLVEPVAASSAAGDLVTAGAAEVAAAVGDSVVTIEAFTSADLSSPLGIADRILGQRPEPSCIGSGVIYSRDGYIVTNNHVVEGAAKIRVRLANGREYDAAKVGTDPYSDLAVVRVSARSLTPARIGDSRALRPGAVVVAVGNPLGFENSVSVGVVSAVRKGPFQVDGRVMGDMIQTDAAINQGNSGGGLFTSDGALIGINTAIVTPRGAAGNIGIGFAIPVHRMRPVTDGLIVRGWITRPWLGISYRLPRSLASALQGAGAGVLLDEVVPGSPADRAGLQPADILCALGDREIRTPADIYDFVERHEPGERVSARILRDGRELTLQMVLGQAPPQPRE